MTDFQKARRNMVDCQISTSSVVNPLVLEAFSVLPRERFVPAQWASIAYNDDDIPLKNDRCILEPAVHARMVQALELTKTSVVLDIGGGSGYSAAVLSFLASTVIAIEENQSVIDAATALWQELDLCNIAGIKADMKKGNAENAPFDAIFISGAVSQIPASLTEQLAEGGRLIAIVKKAGDVMGDVTLLRRSGNAISSHKLFSAGAPYLAGFAPMPEFQF